MQEALEKAIPTVVFGATQPIQMRVEELISGVRATLALKIYGEDLATLDRLAGEMKAVLAKVPGAADLALEANKGKPQMVIRVNRDEAARYGINADEILEVVQAGIGGKTCQHGDRRREALRHPGAARRCVSRQSSRRSATFRSARSPARWCRCRGWPRSRPTKAIPSFGASNCSATR